MLLKIYLALTLSQVLFYYSHSLLLCISSLARPLKTMPSKLLWQRMFVFGQSTTKNSLFLRSLFPLSFLLCMRPTHLIGLPLGNWSLFNLRATYQNSPCALGTFNIYAILQPHFLLKRVF